MGRVVTSPRCVTPFERVKSANIRCHEVPVTPSTRSAEEASVPSKTQRKAPTTLRGGAVRAQEVAEGEVALGEEAAVVVEVEVVLEEEAVVGAVTGLESLEERVDVHRSSHDWARACMCISGQISLWLLMLVLHI